MAISLSSGPFALLRRLYDLPQGKGEFDEGSNSYPNESFEPLEAGVLTELPLIEGRNGGTRDGYIYFNPIEYTQSPPINLLVFPMVDAGEVSVEVVLFHKTEEGLFIPSSTCAFTADSGDSSNPSYTYTYTMEDEFGDEQEHQITLYFADAVSDPTAGTLGVDCQKIQPSSGAAGYAVDLKSAHLVAVILTPSEGEGSPTANVMVGTSNRTNANNRAYSED